MMDKKHLTKGKSGFIFYQRRYKKDNGYKREYFSLHTKDWNVAMKLRNQYDYEIDKFGHIIWESEEQSGIEPLFRDLCIEWYEDKKIDPDVRDDTLDVYKKILTAHFLKAPFVSKQINKIQRFEFEDWWKKHLAKTCGSGTINFYLSTLSNIFKYAVGRYIDINPVKGMKRPKRKKNEVKEIEVLEIPDIVILLNKAKEKEDYFKKKIESVHDYLVVKIFTGLRASEINALETRKHIDLKNDKIKIRQSIVDRVIGPPKTDSSERDVDMCPMVKEAVKRQMERSLKAGTRFLFFNSWEKPIDNDNFTAKVWKPLMDMIDIKQITFEQTRHTYASLLLAEGERISYVSKQMGHANVHITLTRYAKFIPDENDGKILSKVTELIKSDRDVTEIGNSEKSENHNSMESLVIG